jgi:mRNA-degrading endonuclease YafQ of YafQ-DinJ toxin-antitoxin module
MACTLLAAEIHQASAAKVVITGTVRPAAVASASDPGAATSSVSSSAAPRDDGTCAPDEYSGDTISPNYLQDVFMIGEKVGVRIDNEKGQIRLRIPQFVTGCLELKAQVRVQNNDHIVRLRNTQEYKKENINPKYIEKYVLNAVSSKDQSYYKDLPVEKKAAKLQEYYENNFDKVMATMPAQEKATACLNTKGNATVVDGVYQIDGSRLSGSISSAYNDLVLNISNEYDRNKTSKLLFAQFNDNLADYNTSANTINSISYHDGEGPNWKCHKAAPIAASHEHIFIHQSELDRVLATGCSANDPYALFTEMRKLENLMEESSVAGNYTSMLMDWGKAFKKQVEDQKKRLEKEKDAIEEEIEQMLNDFDPEDWDDDELRAYYEDYRDLVKKMDEKVITPALQTTRVLLELKSALPRDDDRRTWYEDNIETLQSEYVSAISGAIHWKNERSRGDEMYRDLEDLGLRTVARDIHEIESRSRLLSEVCRTKSCKSSEAINKQYERVEKLAENERRNLDKEISTTWREVRESKRGRDGGLRRREREVQRSQERYSSSRRKMVKDSNKRYNSAYRKACSGWNRQESCQRFQTSTGPRLQRSLQGRVNRYDESFALSMRAQSEHIERMTYNIEQYRNSRQDDNFRGLAGYDEYSYFRDQPYSYGNDVNFGNYQYGMFNPGAPMPGSQGPAYSPMVPTQNQMMFTR